MIVVADSTPINILVRIGLVDLLPQLFGNVVLPTAVLAELTDARAPSILREFGTALPAWVKVQSPKLVDPQLAADPGEREAICLALELRADLLLVDDKAARALATARGVRITGTLGVLELAARRGHLDFADAVRRIRNTDFMIAESLIASAMARLGLRESEC